MKFTINLVLLFSMAGAHAQTLKIGVITDFEQSPTLSIIIDQMIHEIDQTTGVSRKTSLEATFFGIFDIESAQTSYRQLDGKTDLIIAVGSISAKGLSLMSDLPVPVIALGIIDPGLQDLPYINGTSGKRNFTYIWQTRNLEKELEAFYKIHDFKSVVVFADEKAASTVNKQKARNLIDSLSEKLNTELSIIPVGSDLEQVVDQIPANTDAAYFTVLLSQPESQIQLLINQLNQRKIATFSGNSRLMDNGVLGTMTNENDLQQVIRKLAIMTDGIVSGSELSFMPVTLDTRESLYVNIATARKIQLPIPFEVLFTATIIGDDESAIETYSFEEVAEKALAANLNIQISYRDVEISKVRVKSARSNVLPSIESGLTASQINEKRANAAFNTPEQSLTAGLTLTQVIYSEQAIAAIKIARYLQQAQEYNTEAEVLRVLFDTYTAYSNVLSAKTNVLIQRENLLNTRKNKELAAIRVDLGASNNTDLYRWESELAIANQSVIEAQTTLLSAKLQLNTLLANNLDSEFEVADVSLEDDLFKAFSQGPISKVIKTPESLRIVSDFLVAESQRQNPNKKALTENIHAANRQLEQNQRLLYTPTIALQAQTSQVLARGGAGSILDAQAMALGMTELQDNSWLVGVSLSLPIFDGFGRKAAIQQSKIRLEQLDYSQTLLDQNLELGIRAGVLNLVSASTNIRYSQSASESALENFELVQENYKQGQVTITQLIDAQQTALEARLAAAFSIYEYIQAHLQLEFSAGSFIMLMPEDQLQDFNNRLQQYLNNQN
ncbi:TolC family protein [Fulvivirga ulvae]|uniref:TolC family protein n=1 Tax=Fulvivirga ulvae TaxID=2904245 RepID=UPI001F1AC804|nr:TolC family protein [Fulvivirga ulvae]UII31448.1 TolC family protein [Fulvivirga ulvae]